MIEIFNKMVMANREETLKFVINELKWTKL